MCVAAAVRAADVVVVISGTDGALPAVVAGLVEAPVVAVPTSVGYGAALQVSLALVLSMQAVLLACNVGCWVRAACTLQAAGAAVGCQSCPIH